MRKLIILALVITIVLSSLPASFAEDSEVMTYGEILMDLGFIAGSNGTADEWSPVTREQMVTMLNRLYSAEDAALLGSKRSTFDDKNAPSWAIPHIEYARKKGLTSGKGNNLFGYGEQVSYQEAVTFVMKSLGESVNWSTVIKDALNERYIGSESGLKAPVVLREHVFELFAKALLQKNNQGIPMLSKTGRFSNDKIALFYKRMGKKLTSKQSSLNSDSTKNVEDSSYNYISSIDDLAKVNPLLYRAVQESLQTEDDITEQYAKNVTSLTLYSVRLHDLNGIEVFPNLKKLQLTNVVPDEPDSPEFIGETKLKLTKSILKLDKLEYLNFYLTDISDIEIVKELPNLKTLVFKTTRESDVSFLDELRSLEYLGIYGYSVNDPIIEDLTQLKGLLLRKGVVHSIDYLKYYKNLEVVNIEDGTSLDLSVLSELPLLKALELDDDQDFNDFEYVPDSESNDPNVIVFSSPIIEKYVKSTLKKSVIYQSDLDKIEKVYLQNTMLKNIDDFSKFNNLKVIDISGNLVSDISSLRNLENLKVLTLFDNRVSDLEPLRNLKLTSLNISSNKIRSIDPILQMDSLEELFMGGTLVTSIEGIDKLINLKKVNISNMPLKSFDYILNNQDKMEIYYNNYYTSLEQYIETCTKAQKIVKSLTTTKMTDLQREKVLHDYLVLNTEYKHTRDTDLGFLLRSVAYGPLIKGEAVCGGYTDAMTMLLAYSDISSRKVTGTANGEGHAWNIVEIDGVFYFLDATWNDVSGIRYDYFNIFEDQLESSHDWNKISNPLGN